ncbi:hypothetical protein ZWY2020_011838 [Hordeum vulgare]|nr:hypothetical protein ZWY2020_011838 [Hordeum vulgare]
MAGRGTAAVALVCLVFLAASSAAAAAHVHDAAEHGVPRGLTRRTEADVRAMFDAWLARHGRTYNALAEYVHRFRAFRDNLDFVDAHNARAVQRGGFRLGMNRFADLTNAEFRAPTSAPARLAGAATPSASGTGTERKTCWAFSTVAAVEGVNKIVTGDLVTLSEQELVDCSRNGQNNGCNGGIMDDAFDFIVRNGGIDTEKDYPYAAKEGKCDLAKKARTVVSIDGFEDVPADDEASLMKAVAHQPVSVAIEAGGREFQLYESGVFTGRCGTELDHAVLAVGYGTGTEADGGKDFWLVRNSWGPGWGEGGYIRMERNVTARAGKCGIAMFASYPVKNGPNPKPIPPAPEEKCDRYSSCPAGSTCCCTYGVRSVCLAWGCCPAKGATCCRDRTTCCPSEYPVCNAEKRTCAKSNGSPYTVDALPRTPAKRQRTAVSELVDSIFSS